MSTLESIPEPSPVPSDNFLHTPTASYSLQKIDSHQSANDYIAKHKPTDWRVIAAPTSLYLLCSYSVSA